jgi:hypothetical protein
VNSTAREVLRSHISRKPGYDFPTFSIAGAPRSLTWAGQTSKPISKVRHGGSLRKIGAWSRKPMNRGGTSGLVGSRAGARTRCCICACKAWTMRVGHSRRRTRARSRVLTSVVLPQIIPSSQVEEAGERSAE